MASRKSLLSTLNPPDDVGSAKNEPEKTTKASGFFLVARSNLDDAERPPHRFLESAPDGDDQAPRRVLELIHDEYKALYRFLKIISESISAHVSFAMIFSYQGFHSYDSRRTKHGNQLDLEIAIHAFVDYINFFIVRWLGQIRQMPRLSSIRFLDILMNETACNMFASLVLQLWNDTIVDRNLMFQNKFVVSQSDSESIAVHYRYFETLSGVPEPNLVFASVERYNFMVPYENPTNGYDPDLFITFNEPLNFFIRLSLQAMQNHSVDELKRVLDNAQVSIETRNDGTASDAQVHKMSQGIFSREASAGYIDALARIQRATGMDTPTLMSWMKQKIDRLGFVANIVAMCSCLAMKTKMNVREAVCTRLLLKIDAEVRWIRLLFATNG